MWNLNARKRVLRKTQWCGKCVGCDTPNCLECDNCRDMKKYGGLGTKKKPCSQRKCSNPRWSKHSVIAAKKESSKSNNVTLKELEDLASDIVQKAINSGKLTKQLYEPLATTSNHQQPPQQQQQQQQQHNVLTPGEASYQRKIASYQRKIKQRQQQMAVIRDHQDKGVFVPHQTTKHLEVQKSSWKGVKKHCISNKLEDAAQLNVPNGSFPEVIHYWVTRLERKLNAIIHPNLWVNYMKASNDLLREFTRRSLLEKEPSRNVKPQQIQKLTQQTMKVTHDMSTSHNIQIIQAGSSALTNTVLEEYPVKEGKEEINSNIASDNADNPSFSNKLLKQHPIRIETTVDTHKTFNNILISSLSNKVLEDNPIRVDTEEVDISKTSDSSSSSLLSNKVLDLPSLKVEINEVDSSKASDNIDPYDIAKEEIDVSGDNYDYQMDHFVKHEVDVSRDEYDYQMDIKLEDGYILSAFTPLPMKDKT